MLTGLALIGIVLGFVFFIGIIFILTQYFMMKSDKFSNLGFDRKLVWLNYKTFKEEYNKNPKRYSLYMNSVGVYDKHSDIKFEIYFLDILSYYRYRIFYYNIERNRMKRENQKNIEDFLKLIKE